MICSLCCSTFYSLLIEYTVYRFVAIVIGLLLLTIVYILVCGFVVEYVVCDGTKGKISLNRREKRCYSSVDTILVPICCCCILTIEVGTTKSFHTVMVIVQ